MDPPLISDGSFSTANPSLSEIWPFTCGGSGSGDYGGGLVALRMGTGGFINGLIDGIVNGSGGGGVCGMMNRDGSIEKSTVTGQSGSFGGGDNGNGCGEIGRKMRENVSEDESSKLVSTTSSGNESKESNVKRVKTSNSSEENGSSKAEVETSSAGGKKCAEKQAEPPKDYIHVRARRGQATDSHSLAERARRQKISERMKILQDLVPGCSKVIGKALVLDEIINYIQSLQRQVEVSMYICIRIRAPIAKEASFRTSNSSRLMCQIDNFLACFYSFIDSFISVLILALSFSSTENFRSENFRNLQIISEPLSLSFSIWESIGIPYWKIPEQEKYQCHCVLYTQNLIVYSIFFVYCSSYP